MALPPTATLSPNAVAHPTSPVTPPASGELMGHSPLLAGSVGSARPRTQRVSVASGGRQADNESFDPALSANGRYVAFSSEATNLVAGDTNDTFDVLVRDRRTAVTSRVSVGGRSRQGNGHSSDAAISADGRHVAFFSTASNLVAGDTNAAPDVFVRDRRTGTTRRVSVGPGGRQANSGSGVPPDVLSFWGTAISGDGRYVAFASNASNLVAGDTNAAPDVFVHDRRTRVTSRVSLGRAGAQANSSSYFPALSADGRFVSFTSDATNLVARDTNASGDVFVRDRRTGTTSRVSVGPASRQARHTRPSPGLGELMTSAISGSGRYVAFASTAVNLVSGDTNGTRDVFVRDRRAGVTSRVSARTGGRQGNNASLLSAISRDGVFVAFTSTATNLVQSDTNAVADVFVFNRRTKVTSRVSVGPAGRQANDESRYFAAISAHGRLVAFDSEASNLVTGDTNDTGDVFVRRR